MRRSPAPPIRSDPWDDQITAELAEGNAIPLCHHCLMPHDDSVNFCSNCGAAVGLYTNLLPFPYLFSIGHTLRIGTNESFKKSPLTVCGFLLFGLAEYFILAPIYWLKLLVNLRKPTVTVAQEIPPAAGD